MEKAVRGGRRAAGCFGSLLSVTLASFSLDLAEYSNSFGVRMMRTPQPVGHTHVQCPPRLSFCSERGLSGVRHVWELSFPLKNGQWNFFFWFQESSRKGKRKKKMGDVFASTVHVFATVFDWLSTRNMSWARASRRNKINIYATTSSRYFALLSTHRWR